MRSASLADLVLWRRSHARISSEPCVVYFGTTAKALNIGTENTGTPAGCRHARGTSNAGTVQVWGTTPSVYIVSHGLLAQISIKTL